jgi:hypothetical protein
MKIPFLVMKEKDVEMLPGCLSPTCEILKTFETLVTFAALKDKSLSNATYASTDTGA